MKTLFRLFIIVLISTFILSGCKKTEKGDNSLLMLLGGSSAGTFTKEVALTTTTGVNSGIFGTNSFRHYQILYKPRDLTGSGNIKSILFKYYYDTSAETCSNVTIKLGHTSVTDLGAETTDMGLNINQGKGSAVTVIDNKTVSIPGGLAGEYFEIPLDTQFHYNGFDNLVVDILRTSACSDSVVLVTGAGSSTYTSTAYSTNSGTPDTTAEVNTNINQTKFKFAGGDNTIIPNANADNVIPFDNVNPNYNRVQMLFTPSEINGSGNITGIAFVVEAITAELEYTINVRIGHTILSELQLITWDANFNSGSPVTIVENAELKVPAGIPDMGCVWLPLTKSFNYNGTDNLIIETNVITHTDAMGLRYIYDGTNKRAWGPSVSDGPVGRGPGRYNIKLRFKGSSMDIITAENTTHSDPFAHDWSHRSQYIYRSAELGTKGTITKVAFRLSNDSVPSTYNDFLLVLGNLTATSLYTNFASNLTGAQTVYSGIFSIPIGYKKGDWVEIPLSNPFAYDGVSNLVLQTSSLAGVLNNKTYAGSDTTRYTNRNVFSNISSSASGSYSNDLADVRLIMQ